MDYPFGLTWVSNEPWGYAPYHYGRWAYASNEWFWVPEPVRTYPTYSPALVDFIPVSQSSVAWVALGPGDPYSSWYYGPNWQPVYLNPTNVVQERVVNINVPGAVTVVDTRDFNRVIDPTMISRIDFQTIARVRPVQDPLAVDSLRRAAFETRAAERRISVPQAITQRIENTPVITGTAPLAPPFRRDLARALQVESVPDRARNQKLQFRDERTATVPQGALNRAPNGTAPNIAAEQARERQMAELARQSSRGDRSARTQLNELRRQQVEQQRAERATAQQAQGERVRQQMQTQGVLRQQQRQTEMQRAQQPVIRHSEQQQRVQPQPPPQPERRKPPVEYRPQVQRQAPAAVQQPQPRPQVMRQQEPRPQVMRQQERRAAPQQMQMPQAKPAQPQPHPQPQVERQQRQSPQAKPAEQKKKPPEA